MPDRRHPIGRCDNGNHHNLSRYTPCCFIGLIVYCRKRFVRSRTAHFTFQTISSYYDNYNNMYPHADNDGNRDVGINGKKVIAKNFTHLLVNGVISRSVNNNIVSNENPFGPI